MAGKVDQVVDAEKEWNLDFEKIADDNLNGRVRLYRHIILDKTFNVTLIKSHDVCDNDSFTHWLSWKVEEAKMSRKHIVYVHAECSDYIDNYPQAFIFNICWDGNILIWCTCFMDFRKYVQLNDLFLIPNMMLIADEKSERLVCSFFWVLKNTEIKSISEMYNERMLKAKREAKRLKRFVNSIAVDVQLRCLENYEERSSIDAKVSMHDLCVKILGLQPPDHPMMPDLSIMDVVDDSEIPREVALNGSIDVSLLSIVMSSMGF